jgi:hypothetical protein
VLFGQYWDMFSLDIALTVEIRQAAGYGTPKNQRVAQFRVTQKVNFNPDKYLKLVVGVQNPIEDASNEIGGSVSNAAGQIM